MKCVCNFSFHHYIHMRHGRSKYKITMQKYEPIMIFESIYLFIGILSKRKKMINNNMGQYTFSHSILNAYIYF